MYVEKWVFWGLVILFVWGAIANFRRYARTKKLVEDLARAYDESTARLINYIWRMNIPGKKRDELFELLVKALLSGAESSVTNHSVMDVTDILAMSKMLRDFKMREKLTPVNIFDKDTYDDEKSAEICDLIRYDLSRWLGYADDRS